MREREIPLFSLESQTPVREFDFLGITIQFEMCYTNILQVLDLSKIPLHAKERQDKDPIVIGGGPCTYNPEPLAEFFDLFYIGEGETVYDTLFDVYKQCRREGRTRTEFLERAARIEGIYVPQFYEAEYNEDGTLAAFYPTNPHAPSVVKKQIVMDVTHAPYPKLRLFLLSKQYKTELFWKFREVVYVDADSVRPACCTVLQEREMWNT